MQKMQRQIGTEERQRSLYNPWVAWKKAEGRPQPEHGMTLEEAVKKAETEFESPY